MKFEAKMSNIKKFIYGLRLIFISIINAINKEKNKVDKRISRLKLI